MPLFSPNRLSGTRPGWHLSNVLASVDVYGVNVPSFTLRGQNMVTTAFGGLLSVIVAIIIALYAGTKAHELVFKANPTVNAINQPNSIDKEEVINLGDSTFRFAFQLEGLSKQFVAKDDPKYTRMVVRHFGRRDNKSFQNILPIHKCTLADMEAFYPVSEEWERSFTRRQVDGVFDSFCIDWDTVGIQAKLSATEYEKFEVIFAPCNYMHTSYGYQDLPVSEDCVQDLERQ